MSKIFAYLFTAVLVLGVSFQVQAQDEVSAASLYNEGLEKLKAKNYAEAVPLMEQAIEAADPEADADVVTLARKNGTIAAYKLGTSLRKKEDSEGALAAYDKGIEFNKGFYANYIGRAQALNGKGDKAESVKAFIDAGEICAKSKKEDKAEAMYSKAENIVAVTWGSKDWDATIEVAEAFLSSKDSPDAAYYLADAYNNKGEAQQAIDHIDKAIEWANGKDTSKMYMVKAEAHEKLGDTSSAVSAYKQVSGKYAERAKYKINELEGGK